MSLFFISPQETQQAREDNLLTREPEGDPPLLDVGRVWRGGVRGILDAGAATFDFGSMVANYPNTALQTPDYLLPEDPDLRDAMRRRTDPNYGDRTDLSEYFAQARDDLRETLSRSRAADASQEASFATNLVGGLAEVMSPALVGGALVGRFGGSASALAVSTEERTYRGLVDQGVTDDVARVGGFQDAAFMAAMGVAPISAGGRLWQRAATGAGINLAFGAAMRGNMNAYLNEQGYSDLAEQYRWLDPQAMAIDAALGAAFGGYLGRSIERVDGEAVADQALAEMRAAAQDSPLSAAALVAAGAHNRATAFGVPENKASRQWASQSMARMEEQAARDEAIDPGPVPEDVGFVDLNDVAMMAAEIEYAARAVSEAPMGLTDWVRRQGEVRGERGQVLQRGGIRDDRGDVAGSAGDGLQGFASLLSPNGRSLDDLALSAWENGFFPNHTERPTINEFIDALNRDGRDPGSVHNDEAAAFEARNARDILRYYESRGVDVGLRGDALFEAVRPLSSVADFEAAIRSEFEASGVDPRAIEERLQDLRDSNPEMFDQNGDLLYSMRAPRRGGRGAEAWRGEESFFDERLSPSENKAVEMARNNYTNAEIADELDTSPQTVAVLLSKARSKIGSAIAPASPKGAGGRPGQPMDSMLRLRASLLASGLRVGKTKGTDRTLYSVMGERLGMTAQAVKQRLWKYDRAVARGEIDPLLSMGAREGEAAPAADLIAEAERIFGADWTALSDAGRVEVVDTIEALPFALDPAFAGANAVHQRSAKKTYFVASNLTPAQMRGVVLHEIGIHHGMKDMLGDKGFREVLRQVETMARENHPALREAREMAEAWSTPENRAEETLAYLIEQRADLPLVNRMLSRLRQWLITKFGSTFGMRLTIDDLRALAVTSLRRAAEQARREAVEVVPVTAAAGAEQMPRSAALEGEVLGPAGRDLQAPARAAEDPLDNFTAFREEVADASRRTRGVIEAIDIILGQRLATPDELTMMAPQAARFHLQRVGGDPVMAAASLRDSIAWQRSRLGGFTEGTTQHTSALNDLGQAEAALRMLEGPRQLPAPRFPDGGARGPTEAPTAGDSFPKFSIRQNGPDVVGAKRDPIESPDYQRRVSELRGDGEGSGRAGGSEQGAGGSAGRARPGLGAVSDVLALSGIHLSTKKKVAGQYGDHRAIIDTPFEPAPELETALRATIGDKTKATVIDFDFIDGSNPRETRLPGLHLRYTSVNNALRGKGVGMWFYRQMIHWADRQGLPTYSDGAVSRDAMAAYARLREMGYEVEQIASVLRGEDGLTSIEGGPIYRVSIRDLGLIDAELPGAPLPRGDFQFDAPTLRERQQRIDEQRKREAEHEKLTPGDASVKDDPDAPVFSMGQRRFGMFDGTARELKEAVKAETEAAREMRKGFEAAARCAARHGAGAAAAGGGATFITLNAGANPSAIMMGHALGLAAAIPLGMTAMPLLVRESRRRSPENSALWRMQDTAQRWMESNAEASNARAQEQGALLGDMAGLDEPSAYDDPDAAVGDYSAEMPVTGGAPDNVGVGTGELQGYPEPSSGQPGGGFAINGGRVSMPPAGPAEPPPAPDDSQTLIDLFRPIVEGGE